MGGIFGKVRLPRSFSSTSDPSSANGPNSYQQDSGRYMITPFVFKRWSSMYIDEDGDIAHEFFVELQSDKPEAGKSSRTMRKVDPSLLRPQGYVDYDIPRLNPSIPYIIAEVKVNEWL